MNSTPLISKITERGQITLPKRMRTARLFRGARAVEFSEHAGVVVIRPITSPRHASDHTSLLNHTMRNWSAEENDDLFDFR